MQLSTLVGRTVVIAYSCVDHVWLQLLLIFGALDCVKYILFKCTHVHRHLHFGIVISWIVLKSHNAMLKALRVLLERHNRVFLQRDTHYQVPRTKGIQYLLETPRPLLGLHVTPY